MSVRARRPGLWRHLAAARRHRALSCTASRGPAPPSARPDVAAAVAAELPRWSLPLGSAPVCTRAQQGPAAARRELLRARRKPARGSHGAETRWRL